MKILFVCLGNICRSATAEAIMQKKINIAHINNVEVDSAGILNVHNGQNADSRMISHASKRGYEVDSIARGIVAKDFENADMIIGMDDENIAELKNRARNKEQFHKIFKMTDFGTLAHDIVPDPYFGGEKGFELVIDILENATDGLLEAIKGKITFD